MNTSKDNVGLIILAAGASTRMGKPKQLLPFGATTLIGHAIKAGVDSDCEPVVVVLGARSELIKKTIKDNSVNIAVNNSWQEGMGSSLRVGLKRILALQTVKAVVVMVCDQPSVDSQLLNDIISCFDKWDPTGVACNYGDIVGVPALFGAAMFSELLDISGDKGARALLMKYKDQFKLVSFPEGAMDIDTPNDYKHLTTKFKDKN
ncbi:MAG: nucleotidyltransferase family protein [Cyclobacteriaceae bacterium]